MEKRKLPRLVVQSEYDGEPEMAPPIRRASAPAPLVSDPRPMHPVLVNALYLAGAFIVFFLIVGIVYAWPWFVLGAQIALVLAVIATIGYGLLLVTLKGHALVKGHKQKLAQQQAFAEADLKRANAFADDVVEDVELKRARTQKERRTITFDEQGNAALIDPYSGNVMQLRGNMREYPLLTTYHNAPRISSVTEEREPQPQGLLPEIAMQQPSQDLLLSHIQENSLTVSPGVRASTGEVVTVSLVKVPHMKNIGASGFGKSCLAGAMIDQLVQTNSPRRFQVALLDLEHKTSRLFEEAPHVAHIRVGKRLVQCVATNADEVAQHLDYLVRGELNRRTQLSEQELAREAVLLIYIEEMLSLQYEVDPDLLARMFASINILSVRGRKYGMFLLSCMQTDYSSTELRVSQKMFRFRAAAAIDTTAARAAGFMNKDLIKENFANGQAGQFVVEYPGFSDIVLAPRYDVQQLVERKTGGQPVFEDEEEDVQEVFDECAEDEQSYLETDLHTPCTPPAHPLHTSEQTRTSALQARAGQVQALRANNWGKIAIIEKVWGVKRGSSKAYRMAEAEYEEIIRTLEGDE
jgi:FtsK/SpoIIIE family